MEDRELIRRIQNGQKEYLNEIAKKYYDAQEITAEMVDAMILSMKMNEDSSLDIKFNYMDEFKAIMDKVETLRKEVA